MTIKEVFDLFNHEGIFQETETINSGHINTTLLVRTQHTDSPDYILQKINAEVFKNIPELIQNKVLVTDFLRAKATDQEKENILRMVPTKSGEYYLKDANENYWNLMVFIPNSQVYLKAPNAELAKEAGELFGQFFYLLNNFEANKLFETIPRFHDLDFRLEQFENALKQAKSNRLATAKDSIDDVNKVKDKMYVLQELKNDGSFPLRATHNDTKLSNALFDKNGKGLAVIDLDTLMPGLVHYDFGDSVRTICSSANEDEADLSKVRFLPDYFRTFTQGFLLACKSILSKKEIKHLTLASQYMVFIMGLRFLTDYLNGDIYYTIKYSDHNLVRSKNQLALLKSMMMHENEMQNIIQKEIRNS